MAENKVMATFRLPEDTWEAFKALCKENETNASSALKQYIEMALAARTLYTESMDKTPESIDKRDIQELRSAIDRIDKMVVKQGGKINSLEMVVSQKKTQRPPQPRPPKKIDLSRAKVG